MDASASSYCRSNDGQRQIAEEIYNEFSKILHWREDGNDTILEIGCGPGDITMDYIVPILPQRFNKYVGVDLSEDMVKHANLHYTSPRIRFELWDMAGDTRSLLSAHPEGFDHIFSHFALHWHSNQQKIFQNIFDLLNPNGECVLVFLGKHEYFEALNTVVKLPKWQALFKNKRMARLPFHFDKQRVETYRNLLHSSGFRDYKVEERDGKYVYNSSAEMKRNFTAVNGTIQRMQSDQQDELFHDLLKQFPDDWVERINNGKDYCLKTEYKLVVIYARK